MSSVSSALTSLASVLTMDFVRHLAPGWGEAFFLRFSRASTVFWAAALVAVAYLSSRQVQFVVNAAFSLRGLTSGALLGGLILAVFWRQGRAVPVVFGMITSLAVMIGIQTLPTLSSTKAFWMKTVGSEIYWPWYTLIGVVVTLSTALVVHQVLPRCDPRLPSGKPPACGTSARHPQGPASG